MRTIDAIVLIVFALIFGFAVGRSFDDIERAKCAKANNVYSCELVAVPVRDKPAVN